MLVPRLSWVDVLAWGGAILLGAVLVLPQPQVIEGIVDWVWLGQSQIDARDFGMLCDGSSDDTVAFNRAVTALRTGATKVLYLPRGGCMLDGPPNFSGLSGKSIVGFGVDGTILKNSRPDD